MFLSGSEEAFSELVKRYERKVYFTALRLIGNEEEARDITQNTFLKVLKGISSLKNPSRFKSWLFTIAVNLIKDTLREQRFKKKDVDSEDEIVSHEKEAFKELASFEERAQVLDALNKLPSRQRMAIVLRIYDELSFKEIAKIMECEPATARSLFWIGIKRLREILGVGYEM